MYVSLLYEFDKKFRNRPEIVGILLLPLVRQCIFNRTDEIYSIATSSHHQKSKMDCKLHLTLTIILTSFALISALSIELKYDSSGPLKVNCDSSTTGHSEQFETGDFSGVSCSFSNATEVSFNDCALLFIPERFFRKLRLLRSIQIESPGAESIKRGDFGNNINLKKLSMRKNHLRELPSNLFMYTPNIEEIDFSHNQIGKIDPEAFVDGAEKLRSVKLNKNRIKSLDAGLFASLTHLEYLDLNNNQLEQLNCDVFPPQSVKSFTLLAFEWNELKEIHLDCDTSKSNIKSLFIGNNRIKKLALPDSGFVQSLGALFAHDNSIQKISIESDLMNLKNLHLANNSLTNVSDVFKRCNFLETLNLSSNDLRQLPAHAFEKMKSLWSLFIKNINLSKIDHEIFSDLRNLVELNLSHNKLKKVNFEWFSPSFDRLKELFINNNQLKELTGWSNSIFPNLEVMHIANNRFNCSYLEDFLGTFNLSNIQLIQTPIEKESNINGINCEETSANFLEEKIP